MKISILKTAGLTLALGTVLAMSGCSSKETTPALIAGECVIGGVEGPDWACGAYEAQDSLTATGSAPMSKLGNGFTRREAMANARSNLAQQIETEVKDKVETFLRSTGVASDEVADKVTAQVSKQVAKVTMNGSRQINYWENSGDKSIYVLVAVSTNSINQEAKNILTSSFKNDDALWQQFQAKQALENLEKEFPTQEQ
jgi:hypothetical protein